MSTDKQFILAGLPGSGKTTWLGALWHLIESNEVSSRLRLDRIEGDVSFLNLVRDRWMMAEKPERTDADVVQPVVLHLIEGPDATPVALQIPDLAGETYRVEWHYRQRSVQQQTRITSADGMLLLIHCRVQQPILLTEAAFMLAAGPAAAAVAAEADERPWDPERAPTQAMLVDLLQFAAAARSGRRLRVAVLITAWDLVPEPRPEPASWIRSELPLLHQYLGANPEWFEARIYGVSAQGGDYEAPADRAKLTENLLHAERVIINGPDCESHDLTAPIHWLLS